jgi:phosphonate transport system substrate-binding protein
MKPIKMLFIWIILCYSCTAIAAQNEQLKPLRVGMLPSLSLQKLFERYKPLQKYLQQKLHRPVILLTAASYASYIKRASEYEYDLYFAAPHMAALAEEDYGYRRISLMTRDLRGVLVVRSNGEIKKVSDLKGRTVSAPQESAIITMMGELLLQAHHLHPGKDVKINYTSTHNNAIFALTKGKSDAAIVSAPIFDILSRTIHDKLTILETTRTASHLMFMASPKLSEQEYAQLKQVMLAFKADGAGKEFFRRSPYGDSAAIHDKDMREMQPYVKMLRKLLAEKTRDKARTLRR